MDEPATTTKPEGQSPQDASRYWQVQIQLAERACKDWWQEAENIVSRYKAERKFEKIKTSRRVNVFFSNTETLRAAVYARTAKPDVRQRFATNNPIARSCAEVLERTISYSADRISHDVAVKAAVLAALTSGAGVVWTEYEPKEGLLPVLDPMTGQPAVDPMTGQPMQQPGIVDQDLRDRHVHYKDFLWSPARCWDDVWWIARRHRMTRDDLKENQFPEPDKIPLNWTPDNGQKTENVPDEIKRAEVWEIWNKADRTRRWIVKGHPIELRRDPDPLGLEDFWPTPGILMFIIGDDALMPVPMFRQYAELAEDLDETQSRISMLTRALKRRGVRDGSIEELSRLAKANDNEFIPVKNWQHFAQKGGLEGAFQTEDIETLSKVLVGLYQSQDMLEAKIDKITGIADIMRGDGDASETATAQSIKAQYGGLRLKDMQKAVQQYLRGLMRIKAELIAEHFEPHVLSDMTGIEVNDQMMELLRTEKTRAYNIDVETDSTVFEDAEAEKQARVEVLEAVTGALERGLPIMQAMPEFSEILFESITLLLKTMKGGRQMEDVVDRARQAFQKRLANPQPQENPQAEVAKIKADAEQQKAKADVEMKVLDLETHRAKHQMGMEKMQAQAAFNSMQQQVPIDAGPGDQTGQYGP